MKLNLTETLETLEDVVSRHLLQSIESQQPMHPRFVADRAAASEGLASLESAEMEEFLAHPEYRDVGPVTGEPTTFELPKGKTWGDHTTHGDPVVIENVQGRLWLTLGHGLRDDILLLPGQSYISRPGDLPVIEALEPSRVRLRSVR